MQTSQLAKELIDHPNTEVYIWLQDKDGFWRERPVLGIEEVRDGLLMLKFEEHEGDHVPAQEASHAE